MPHYRTLTVNPDNLALLESSIALHLDTLDEIEQAVRSGTPQGEAIAQFQIPQERFDEMRGELKALYRRVTGRDYQLSEPLSRALLDLSADKTQGTH